MDWWKETIKSYLIKQIEKGNAIVAKIDEMIVGYMAWMYFDFHDERTAFDYCLKIGKPFIHVSYETANPNASKFWPKYFRPVIRSVRRTINKDAN